MQSQQPRIDTVGRPKRNQLIEQPDGLLAEPRFGLQGQELDELTAELQDLDGHLLLHTVGLKQVPEQPLHYVEGLLLGDLGLVGGLDAIPERVEVVDGGDGLLGDLVGLHYPA